MSLRALEALFAAALQSDAPLSIAKAYVAAANAARGEGDEDREAFFLTQAYVYALEAGSLQSEDIANRLRRLGRND